MFAKRLKLSDDHEFLIKMMAKEFNMTFEEAGAFVLEQGFVFNRILSESDEKILQICKMEQDNEMMKKVIQWHRNLWELEREE